MNFNERCEFWKGLHELRNIFEKLKLCMSCSMSSRAALPLLTNRNQTCDTFWKGLHELRNLFEKLKLCMSCSVSSVLALWSSLRLSKAFCSKSHFRQMPYPNKLQQYKLASPKGSPIVKRIFKSVDFGFPLLRAHFLFNLIFELNSKQLLQRALQELDSYWLGSYFFSMGATLLTRNATQNS